jgi:hypothetical protein
LLVLVQLLVPSTAVLSALLLRLRTAAAVVAAVRRASTECCCCCCGAGGLFPLFGSEPELAQYSRRAVTPGHMSGESPEEAPVVAPSEGEEAAAPTETGDVGFAEPMPPLEPRQTVVIEFEGAEQTIGFGKDSDAAVLERTICVACGVPWGSVTRLVDASGAVYGTEPALLPDGKRLLLEVLATPLPLNIPSALVPGPEAVAAAQEGWLGDETTIPLVDSPAAVSGEPEAQLQAEEEEEEEDSVGELPATLKILVCGDTGVGKSTYVQRIKAKNQRKFKLSKEEPIPTEGADVTAVEIATSRGTKKEPELVTLKVWEIGGGEDRSGLRSTYYRGAHAAFIFFRFGRIDTYWSAMRWRNEIVRACGDGLPILVCGLGSDTKEARGEAHGPEKPGAPPLPPGAEKWKAAELLMVDTPCVKISNKTGSNAFLPVNWVLGLQSGDAAIRCKKDGSGEVVSEGQTDWHGITAHIMSTLQGMPTS